MEFIKRFQQRKFCIGDVRKLNYMILSLMISVAVTSIVWSLSIHVLSGDFYNGFIGAKLAFRERHLDQMENIEKDIWKQDLERILNETYTIEPVDRIKADALIMPKLRDNLPSTQKPKTIKIAHVFQAKNSRVPESPTISNMNMLDSDDKESTTKMPKTFNIEEDRKFLALMTIDIHKTHWYQTAAVKFVYSFPFFSEIVAIVWTVMCFIFQSGVNKTWGLPKPYRIVLPSIIVFSIMTIANFTYLLLANSFLKTFCHDLRANLSKPNVISCGDAMSILRPVIRSQALSHNTYLILYRVSYTLALIFWICALIIMVLRFLLAIDFQLVHVETTYDREIREKRLKTQELKEVQPNSIKSVTAADKLNLKNEPGEYATTRTTTTPTLNVKNDKDKSEDDFQSAKSNLSEVATPLLDELNPTSGVVKT